MILAVDGFNLIYKFPELEERMYANDLRGARLGLLQILSKYRRYLKNTKIYIFFDGKKEKSNPTRQETYDGMEIFYSQLDKADDLIKEFVKQHSKPNEIQIITSDNEILYYCRKFKSKTSTSEEFAKQVSIRLTAPDEEPEEDPVLNEEELSFWKEMFRKRKA